MKNIEEKPKNKNIKIKPKIINSFLVCKFLSFYLYKSRKIIDYHQNVASANYVTKKLNKSNPVYFNYSLRCKTEFELQIGINPP